MRDFWRRVWFLTKPYWASHDKYRAWSLLAILLVLGFLVVRVQVDVNDLTRQFYDALQQYQPKTAIRLALRYVLLVIVFATLLALSSYIGNTLVNRWRRWLTQYYLERWLDRYAFYRMPLYGQGVDNPDQRISDDVESFTSTTLGLFNGFYATFIQLVTFTIVLWRLSGTFHLNIHTWHLAIPGYLVWCAVLYSLVSTCITMWIGRKLRPLNYQQQHYNADLRFGLMRVRENADSLALMNAAQTEKQRLLSIYQPIYRNFARLIVVGSQLTLFNKTIDTISMMLGILFALPKFVVEKMTVGDLMQMATAFSYVVNGLCFFMDAYAQIAAWRAVIDRLIEFSNQMSLVDQQVNPCIQSQSRDTALHVQGLKIDTPNGRALLSDWSETIQAGERVLVMGAFGCGKSTLLRCIAGLWPFAQGRIEKPNGRFIFLAQKPYFPIGTLKNALNFGYGPFSEAAIVNALTSLQLQRFVPLLEQDDHWMQCLSLGEQQMLAIARVLLVQPDWLFLDEATASLDLASEAVVYQSLMEELPMLTLVSIGHRSSLTTYHSRTLHL